MVSASAPQSPEAVREILATVMDPEVPVLSVIELGIVRDVTVVGDLITVTLTPTYSGCPAMHEIESDIRAALAAHGASTVEIKTVYAPAWTTDWIPDEAKEKLRAYGIAPPERAEHGGLVTLSRRRESVACPYCGSHDTELKSEFGSTACKSINVCRACKQPFEQFKSI